MLYLLCWMIALSNYEHGAAEPTDWMKPPGWTGNFWGPAATRARAAGQLPPLPSNPAMARWRRWGRAFFARVTSSSGSVMRGSCAAWFPQPVHR